MAHTECAQREPGATVGKTVSIIISLIGEDLRRTLDVAKTNEGIAAIILALLVVGLCQLMSYLHIAGVY